MHSGHCIDSALCGLVSNCLEFETTLLSHSRYFITCVGDDRCATDLYRILDFSVWVEVVAMLSLVYCNLWPRW